MDPQPIPDLIKQFEREGKKKESKKRTKKEIVDEMNFDLTDIDNEPMTMDEIFDFNSSEEENEFEEEDSHDRKVISSLEQSLDKHKKIYKSKVELAKLEAEQAEKSLKPIESSNKGIRLYEKSNGFILFCKQTNVRFISVMQ